MRIDSVHRDDSEGGWRGRGAHHSVPTRILVLKEAKGTHEINSGGSPNENMASYFRTPQFHAINDICLYYDCIMLIQL